MYRRNTRIAVTPTRRLLLPIVRSCSCLSAAYCSDADTHVVLALCLVWPHWPQHTSHSSRTARALALNAPRLHHSQHAASNPRVTGLVSSPQPSKDITLAYQWPPPTSRIASHRLRRPTRAARLCHLAVRQLRQLQSQMPSKTVSRPSFLPPMQTLRSGMP